MSSFRRFATGVSNTVVSETSNITNYQPSTPACDIFARRSLHALVESVFCRQGSGKLVHVSGGALRWDVRQNASSDLRFYTAVAIDERNFTEPALEIHCYYSRCSTKKPVHMSITVPLQKILLNSHPVLSAWLRQVKLRGPCVEVLPGNSARFTEHIK